MDYLIITEVSEGLPKLPGLPASPRLSEANISTLAITAILAILGNSYCTFTLAWYLPFAVTLTTSPDGRYGFSTMGLAHSSSQPFSIASTVYLPGRTVASVNVPSLSLWSRRNSGALLAGSSGTHTNM